MKIIEPSYEIFGTPINTEAILKKIELCGRVCYKSEEKVSHDSSSPFVRGLVKSGHLSVIEHAALSVRFIVSRSFSHELVRHRVASYSQCSQRYVGYNGKDIEFIKPVDFEQGTDAYELWENSCYIAEDAYKQFRSNGFSPEASRVVLPNCTATEIIVTANMREWKHILSLRTEKVASKEMRQIMIPLQDELHGLLPEIF